MQIKIVAAKDLNPSKSLRAEDYVGSSDHGALVENFRDNIKQKIERAESELAALRSFNKDGRVLHDQELNQLVEELEQVCKDRFASLDLFNEDCKTIANVLHRLAISDTPWMDGFSDFEIGLHDGTIVYRHRDEKTKIENACALHEAPAKDRWKIAKEKAVSDFLMGVIDLVKTEEGSQQTEAEMNQHAPDCPDANCPDA